MIDCHRKRRGRESDLLKLEFFFFFFFGRLPEEGLNTAPAVTGQLSVAAPRLLRKLLNETVKLDMLSSDQRNTIIQIS